jgi:23S rRNA pseudouridine1911/1915/1917 synthase
MQDATMTSSEPNSNEPRVFHVPANLEGQTVLSALRQLVPGVSWNELRHKLRKRFLMVDGGLCVDEGRRVREGTVIKWMHQPIPAPPSEENLKVVHCDRHVVVVEKPAGITTLRHAEERHWPSRRKQLQPTLDELVGRVIGRREAAAAASRQKMRHRSIKEEQRFEPAWIRAVHRLDRDTSGLMVFARTVPAEVELIKQFKKHSVKRSYFAIAQGRVEAMKIETFFTRDRGDGLRGSTTDEKSGERAVTFIEPQEFLPNHTLVRCRLETGRTHQIRIHLSEAGHMLCGEKVYNRPLGGKVIADASGAPRQMLHAVELGFVHPATQEELHFTSPIPSDMAKVLQHLRQ